MRFIVADSAGTGTLTDKDGMTHELHTDSWTETDGRDSITATTGPVTVRYREDGHTVEVAAGETYQVEGPANDDVIDVRTATDAAEEVVAAMDGLGTDEERIYRALEMAPEGQSREPWFDQLRFIFSQRTGRELDDALADELSGGELDRAKALLH